jgi:ectoine hydroxylase-related dioxygenase (phytanoyl-CoA dioxygenase family)
MEINDQYNKNGYLILENIYSSAEVDKIKKIVNELDVEKFEHSKDKDGYPFRITNILPKKKELKKLIEKPEILSILKECIGDNVVFFKDKYISKRKGSRGEFVPHTDGAFITYNYRLKKETPGWWTYATKFVHLNIMVTDNTEKNGCMYIAQRESTDPNYYINKYFLNERSIKSGETDPKFHDEIKKRSIPVTGKKGTVLIFDPLCLHYSENNISNDLRDLFLVTYNRAKDGDNYKLSNIDKQNAIKHHKEFIDDQ